MKAGDKVWVRAFGHHGIAHSFPHWKPIQVTIEYVGVRGTANIRLETGELWVKALTDLYPSEADCAAVIQKEYEETWHLLKDLFK